MDIKPLCVMTPIAAVWVMRRWFKHSLNDFIKSRPCEFDPQLALENVRAAIEEETLSG